VVLVGFGGVRQFSFIWRTV
jgi:hypothetical protein